MQITLTLYVQPGAKKTRVLGMHGANLKVSLNAPPVEGQANAALLAWLAKQLGLKIRQLKLIRGEKSRIKTIAVELPEETHFNKENLIQALLKII